jgi:hypothetical protein
MKLSHFSKTEIAGIRSTEQSPRYGQWSTHDKPRGLWVSVDGDYDWQSWCESKGFGIGPIRYRVVLKSMDRVLQLTTSLEILVFTERYGHDSGRYSFQDVAIHWDEVAKEYAGIIIAPYCWELRMDERTNWYYGWDCASGCIWDSSVVESVTALESAVLSGRACLLTRPQ